MNKETQDILSVRKPRVHKYQSGNTFYQHLVVNFKNKRYAYSRLVIEKHFQRKLKKDEIVHHKNENPLDNRISNLQIMEKSEHNSFHSS